MRNLNKPPRYNVASIQAQQTLGGDVMQSDENGQYVEWRDYKWLLDSYAFVRDQWKDLDSEVERLKAVSTIEQRTIQGLQQTPEWSEIARLTAYCRELEGKVSHLDLFKSVVEKFFNSADLKNPPDAQSCYALAEKLKQLPDSILDFTEEQVRDNPAWALAVFRHKVKEMQYKRIHDLNEIGGEQEENALLKAEVESVRQVAQDNKTETEATRIENAHLKAEVERLTETIEKVITAADVIDERNQRLIAEVERLTKAGDELERVLISRSGSYEAGNASHEWQSAKNYKQS